MTATRTRAQQGTTPQQVFQSAIASLNSGNVGALQLSGTIEAPAGEDSDTGTFSGQCSISGTSQLQMQLSSGTRTENSLIAAGVASGSWVDEQGTAHAMAPQNVQTPAAWFCPQVVLSSILKSPGSMTIQFVGSETKNGIAALHYLVAPPSLSSASDGSSSISAIAQTDIYLNATTLQPVAFDFNAHPDNNALVNIPIEIQFSNYVNLGGVLVPGTVSKYMNGALVVTLQATSATPSASSVTTN
ncbi:hypothetical protein [Terracidiphilus gabretensis]|uniref:hypothetical protein n=1 Tax=Terracidiphilus gabretensis TaxID=1577687 RepID=UPI0012FB72B8|nr:hypothetical protein [Terracidiphilus gabretensis]